MLNDSELEDVRRRVEGEPEGSPARVLLAEVDRLRAEKAGKIRKEFVQYAMRDHGLTEEEADRLHLFVLRGGKISMEDGPCGCAHGTVVTPGCLGGKLEKCRKCNGRGRRSRIKVPE